MKAVLLSGNNSSFGDRDKDANNNVPLQDLARCCKSRYACRHINHHVRLWHLSGWGCAQNHGSVANLLKAYTKLVTELTAPSTEHAGAFQIHGRVVGLPAANIGQKR